VREGKKRRFTEMEIREILRDREEGEYERRPDGM
jgi:hypothetical protein